MKDKYIEFRKLVNIKIKIRLKKWEEQVMNETLEHVQ